MVSGQNDIGATEFIDDDTHEIFQLVNSLLTSGEDLLVISMASGIYGVMIDIYYLHALHQCRTLTAFHQVQLRCLQSYALGIGVFQHRITVPGLGRLTICQYRQVPIALQLYGQFFMGKQGCHAKFGDTGEHGLAALQLHLAGNLPLQVTGQLCRYLIPHSIRNDNKNAVFLPGHLTLVKFILLENLLNPAVLGKVRGNVLCPILPKLCQIAIGILIFHQFGQLLIGIIQA